MTSGNGTSDSGQRGGGGQAAQAVARCHVLTHLIEGFVIQEGAEPFPVERPSFSIEGLRRTTADAKMDRLLPQELKAPEPVLICELCGKVDLASVFKRTKRFCSTVCAKRYNVGCTKRVGLFPNRKTTLQNLRRQRAQEGPHDPHDPLHPSSECQRKKPAAAHSVHPAPAESSQCSDLSGYNDAPPGRAQLPLMPHSLLPSDPGQWDIEDVYEFISTRPGCLEVAEEFRCQEIDGQALLLLTEDHLMATMNLKLGPALKIYAEISMLKYS